MSTNPHAHKQKAFLWKFKKKQRFEPQGWCDFSQHQWYRSHSNTIICVFKKKKKSLQHLHLSAQTAVVNCLFICAHLFCYECHSDKLPNPINTNIIMFSCIKCPMKATTNSQSKPNEEHEMLYFKITSNQTHSYHKHPCWAHFSSYILVHVFSSRVTVIFTNTAWSESSWSLI